MRVLHCLLAALLAVAAATAQVGGSGTIQGTVTDPPGAVVAEATVTATNVATGVENSPQDHGGRVLCAPSAHCRRVYRYGQGHRFSNSTQTHVIVEALANVAVNPKLQIGAASQSITVEAAPTTLKADDVALGSSMDNRVYDSLPLAMKRRFRRGIPRRSPASPAGSTITAPRRPVHPPAPSTAARPIRTRCTSKVCR